MRNQETFKEDNKYFTAILEGVNQDTVFDDFVNNRETSTNTFGKILVVRSGFCYREVITGIKIPMKFLYYSVDPNETSPYYTIPRTAFHATSVYTGEITKDVFNYYVFTNNNDEFKQNLADFIISSKQQLKCNKKSKVLARR